VADEYEADATPEYAGADPAAGVAIHFEHVTRKFGRLVAIDRLSLAIPRGVIFGCLGPNGAGKTTAIRMLVGLLKPDAGCIRVCGADVVREPLRAKAAIGFVPDEPDVYGKLTLPEFLSFSASLYGARGTGAMHRAQDLIERLGLAGREREMLEGFSHGMRQKASLAAALLHEPSVLVLDEPTVGLDPRAARRVKDLLRELAAGGCTVFLTTHVLEIAERVCDRVGVLDKGRLIVEGTLDELRDTVGAGTHASLEDVFLQLTDDTDERDADRRT
jgi:ABC-2 type transport system ATP-binding protein